MAIKIAGTEVINDNRELVLAKLTEINSSIADTAVDVFVYDTSQDSDGGAWRHRTQATSWYNETLNTSTRGSRKEFPAVAVITIDATTDYVTIYDGDDPDLPMWMVFNTASNRLIRYDTSFGNVAIKNGRMVVGNNATIGGLSIIDFVMDYGEHHNSLVNDIRKYYGLVNRNVSIADGTAGSRFTTGTSVWLLSLVNDVAMTVLPNAPIDAATGLPVPTIAVATDGGVSVIKDDGTVVDAPQPAYDGPISIGEDGVFFVGRGLASTNVIYGFELSSLDTSSADYFYASTSVPYLGSAISGGFVKDVVRTGVDSFSYGYDTHFGNIAEQRQDITKGMVNVVTSSYNTGWMNGDIKLATLSDTDDTDVTGSELVTNGTFDSDVSSWSAGDAGSGVSYDSGTLLLTNNDNSPAFVGSSYFTTVVGKTYVFSFDVTARSNPSKQARILVVGQTAGTVIDSGAIYAVGSYFVTFTANDTSTQVLFSNGDQTASTGSFNFDNASVRLAEEDRSVNGKGLQVFGTVTKNPVATGADLVAYSGFSGSNFLVQPYNSDLDFGTGDFSITTWFRNSVGLSGNAYILASGLLSGGWTGNGHIILVLNSTENMVFSTTANNFTNYTEVVSSQSFNDGVWHCATAVRQGNNMSLYIDGQLSNVTNGTLRDVSNSSQNLIVGLAAETGFPSSNWRGSLALLRLSATAPSPEQIKKIYEDEKVLFQENAEATLYGSSDAVTALAYDDSTELLHVGTSAGRSVFQGLRRVNNTTTAVGAAISASNGLVADE